MAAKAKKKQSVRKKSAVTKKKKKSVTNAKRAAAPKGGKKAGARSKRVATPKVAKKAGAKSKRASKPKAVKLHPMILPSHLSIKHIAELKATLRTAHDADSSVIIDASEVETIDTAALQLLLAFANSVRQMSRSLEWTNPSGAFCDLAGLLALSQYLGIAGAADAADDDNLCPVF